MNYKELIFNKIVRCKKCGNICKKHGNRILKEILEGSKIKAQRYICKDCNYTFTLNPSLKKKPFNEKTKSFVSFLNSYANLNSNQISSLLNKKVSKNGINNYLNRRSVTPIISSNIFKVDLELARKFVKEKSGFKGVYWSGIILKGIPNLFVAVLFRPKEKTETESWKEIKKTCLSLQQNIEELKYFKNLNSYTSLDKVDSGFNGIDRFLDRKSQKKFAKSNWYVVQIEAATGWPVYVFFTPKIIVSELKANVFIPSKPEEKEIPKPRKPYYRDWGKRKKPPQKLIPYDLQVRK